nr:PREDICTED: fanconi-associated nuclease 1 homolog isoform X2 [Musa acuminata subsp. malaccensis]
MNRSYPTTSPISIAVRRSEGLGRPIGRFAMHLHGWESLKRLIGKRRRPRSPHLARLLSPPNPTSDSRGDVASDADTQPSSSSAEEPATTMEGHGVYDMDWVSCPVCDRSIRGTNHNVNSHIDTCLIAGTKRKFTQCTLLQFQFFKRSKMESSQDGVKRETEDTVNAVFSSKNDSSNALLLPGDSHGSRNGNTRGLSSDHSPRNIETFTEIVPPETTVLDNTISHEIMVPCGTYMFPQMNMDKLDACGTKGDDSVITFETYIVGRRFHESIELQQGARVSVAREPENVKDRNAIKVLYADSGRVEMLGYLPRELSKHLSPLIDCRYIECEGFVDSLPELRHDDVPIQLVCQKSVACDEKKSAHLDFSESLWENFLLATENIKLQSPKMTKYQKNFSLMIEEVMSHHSQLFTVEEKMFTGSFNSLSDEGQRLFIRLYTRKGPWFRVSNISYPEIQDPQKAVEELQLAGYIYSFQSSEDPFIYDMKEVIDLLNVSEMRKVINLELPKKRINCARRHELINILFSAYANGACPLLPKMVLGQVGTCIRISSSSDILFWRIQRLFFLNGEQDLSAFLLIDLGMIKFPDYVCNISHRIFQDRTDLLEYEEAIEVAQIMDESLEESNMEMVIRCIDISDIRMCTSFRGKSQSSTSGTPPQFFSTFSASFVYSKVLSLGVSFFEREHRYEDAIRLLKGLLRRIIHDSRRGYWMLRLSVDLEHMNRLNESLSVAEEGILDPWVRAGSRIALQRRVLRLGKPPRRWRIPDYADSVKRKIKEVCIRGRPLTSETATKNSYYGYDGELCGVEQLALQFYAEEGGGWSGVHSESGIWMTIFGLLMWDVIFFNVPDVFMSRFQIAPLDFDTDDFYVTRESLIESQLQKINGGMAEEILISSWESHVGIACRGVNWERQSLSDLRVAVACIGGSPLASLCRHLATDYRSWSSGMPDLLLWRFHGDKGEGEAKLVEVKGPTDRLSEQQRAWLLTLMDCGFDTEVCKVRPTLKCQ